MRLARPLVIMARGASQAAVWKRPSSASSCVKPCIRKKPAASPALRALQSRGGLEAGGSEAYHLCMYFEYFLSAELVRRAYKKAMRMRVRNGAGGRKELGREE